MRRRGEIVAVVLRKTGVLPDARWQQLTSVRAMLAWVRGHQGGEDYLQEHRATMLTSRANRAKFFSHAGLLLGGPIIQIPPNR